MKQFLLIFSLLISVSTFGQEGKTKDFLSEIKNYDISSLLTLKKIQTEDDTIYVERLEPLGYIGDNYQRFYIHFISVIQNPNNKLEYFVYGKTSVKNNICSFQGRMIIKESNTYVESDMPPLKEGFVKGEYEFFEDSKQKETGFLKGTFRTDFYIDKKGIIKYNALIFVADGFDNNQFEGTWTSYKTGKSKKCNWGDYRIPDSKELDCGTAEFMPLEKYYTSDWLGYMIEKKATKNIINNSEKNIWWKE